jgi:hypothetical protein
VLEKTEVIGTTGLSRVMLPAGRHDLVFTNDALDFRTTLPGSTPGVTTPMHTDTERFALSTHRRGRT